MAEEYDMSNVKDIKTFTKIDYLNNPAAGVSCQMFGSGKSLIEGISYLIMFMYREYHKQTKNGDESESFDRGDVVDFVSEIAADALTRIYASMEVLRLEGDNPAENEEDEEDEEPFDE